MAATPVSDHSPTPLIAQYYGQKGHFMRFRGTPWQSRGVAHNITISVLVSTRYNSKHMAKDTTFVLDITAAGKQILQDMAADVVEQSGQAILDRATRMGAAMSKTPPTFEISSRVGTIKKGTRAITTITAADSGDAHQNYLAHQALLKAKDAGRV